MLSRDDSDSLELTLAEPGDAEALVEVIHAAFAGRAAVNPPPPALAETTASLTARLTGDAHQPAVDAVIARVGGEVAGVVLLVPDPARPGVAQLQRVAVHPRCQGQGVAAALIGAAHAQAVVRGFESTELFVRDEFPRLRQWWERHGYRPLPGRTAAAGVVLGRRLPLALSVPDADAMRDLGRRLADRLRAGDVLILSGELGAGKTTLTQGLGEALDVDGPIISPTFVLSRVHRARGGGPDLVHVDAYRLGDAAEVDDLDLDSELARCVTVVEWGEGLAEQLSPDRLEITIDRGADDDGRTVWVQPIGPRWDGVPLDWEPPSPGTAAAQTSDSEGAGA